MTRKQLPKAIKPAGSGLRYIPGEAGTEAPLPQSVTAKPTTPKEPVQVEADDWTPSPPPANDSFVVLPPLTKGEAERRLQLAFKIVDRHKMYAGLGGLVPMPAVNVASVTAINLRMVKVLSDLYGIAFERDKMRSIVLGLMGGATPTGLAAATATTLSFAAPFAGAFGLVVSTVVAATLTRRIGLYFVERFESETLVVR
jgi:uncharacterized protein (DUF697 family)